MNSHHASNCSIDLARGVICDCSYGVTVPPATCAQGGVVFSMQYTNELIDLLVSCWEYFDNRADVSDGDYGEPRPNREMLMCGEIRRTLARLGHEL